MTHHITQEELNELYYYNADTGKLSHKFYDRLNKLPPRILVDNPKKPLSILINQKHYQVHRLVWIYVYGSVPHGRCIMHINGDRRDNRISNLRVSTYAKKPRSMGIFRGCHLLKNGKYKVEFCYRGRTYYQGCFSTIEQAYERYTKARAKIIPQEMENGV